MARSTTKRTRRRSVRCARRRRLDRHAAGGALDHRVVRQGPRHSTRRTGRLHPRGMATRSTPLPERDRFLTSVGALRDWLAYVGRDATWRIALASMFGCASTQVPLPNDTPLARG